MVISINGVECRKAPAAGRGRNYCNSHLNCRLCKYLSEIFHCECKSVPKTQMAQFLVRNTNEINPIQLRYILKPKA